MKRKYENPILCVEELLQHNILMTSDSDGSDIFIDPWEGWGDMGANAVDDAGQDFWS